MGTHNSLEVLQGVVVHEVTVDGCQLLVDVYGSTSNVCGSVRFTVDEPRRRRSVVALLDRWARESTPLTLIRTGSLTALQHDAAAFGRELGATA